MVKIKPPRQAFGVVNLSSVAWNTIVVLPVEKAGELATLLAQGQMWCRHLDDSYRLRGYYSVDESGDRATLPVIEVIDEDELDRRLEIGIRIVEHQKMKAEAERLEQEAKRPAESTEAEAS
jgi:hypothetical protein